MVPVHLQVGGAGGGGRQGGNTNRHTSTSSDGWGRGTGWAYLYFEYSPNSVYTEGFWQLGKDIYEHTRTPPAQLIVNFWCYSLYLLPEGHTHLVNTKHTEVPLSTVKHNGFGTCSIQVPLWLPPWPPGATNASQMPHRCSLPVSKKHCLGSRVGIICSNWSIL